MTFHKYFIKKPTSESSKKPQSIKVYKPPFYFYENASQEAAI